MIAPDLLGHGRSDKPRADYSVAAYANGMRDLLSVLDIDSVTVVGHSLGGGVAMQFAYQFPQLVERLILVGAGGVTRDVNIALRFASLPMGSEALALLRLPLVLPALVSGLVLSFARALGEFGATLTFAGSLQGRTRTLPLEIYLQREADPDAAVALSLLLVVVAATVVLVGYRR